MQNSSRFVSLAGEFAVEHATRSEIESLWSPKWRVWFADEDAAASKALMTDEQLDDQQLPGHARVDLTGDSG